MKELNAFRKFLAEGKNKEFTFYFKKGKTGEEQAKKAKAILKSEGINFESGGKMAIDFPATADKEKIKSILRKNGVTRYIVGTATNEGKGSTVKLSQSDMDKLHKDKEIEVDDHIIQFGEGEENVSEELIYIQDENVMDQLEDSQIDFELVGKYDPDKGQAVKVFDPADVDKIKNLSENTTMPDIDIMGEKFNFSDICPSAHKLVQNQALVYQGHSRVLPTVLSFAIKHKNFFNLERKALGPQGITVDEFNDEVKRLYVEILNIAEKLGVRKSAKEYMDMHMGKIKDNGFKASEPGGSSDRNFEEGYEPTDKELDFADEIEYEQDWKAEQDDLFGTPDYKRRRGYYMDEEGDEDEFLEEALKRVRKVLGDSIEGYMDLHKNDVVLESFLGEEELNEEPLDEKQKYADDQLKFKEGDTVYFKNVKGGKNLPMTITGPGKFMKSNRLDAGGKEVVFPVKGGPGGKGMYAADDLVKEGSLDENITQDILKKHPKKYKDEKAVQMAAAKLMKSPKFKGKGIGPVLQALLKGSLNEEIEMVEPDRGHDFYKLNKDVELELQTGSTSVTRAPGVLLHPVFGKKIIARKGQYIISFFGQLFYVDMDAEFATKVPKHEDSDNVENLRGALVSVDMAPKFRGGWKDWLNEPL